MILDYDIPVQNKDYNTVSSYQNIDNTALNQYNQNTTNIDTSNILNNQKTGGDKLNEAK